MTRRSFCFLFGAGVAGAMLPAPPLIQMTYVHGVSLKIVFDDADFINWLHPKTILKEIESRRTKPFDATWVGTNKLGGKP